MSSDHSGPSAYEAAVDPAKYRQPDVAFGSCKHGPVAVLCPTSGKTGRNGRTAGIGATLFWLTCPNLNNLIARFERFNVISLLTVKMAGDESLRSLHIASHQHYEDMVPRLLSEAQASFFVQHFIQHPDVTKRKYGNAAVGHIDDLKCLHALVAQSIAGASNPLGNMCLRYILLLEKKVEDVLTAKRSTVAACSGQSEGKQVEGANSTAVPTTAGAAASSSSASSGDPDVCKVVDNIEDMIRWIDEVGVQVACAPLLDNAEKDLACFAAKCCDAADRILLAAEGHAPRTRKKHRRN